MMTKILIETKSTHYGEVEIDLPFYSYYQEENKEIFVKIDEKNFYKIERQVFMGDISFFKSNNHGYIAELWFKAESNKETWDNAVKECKGFVKLFN